jgi:hypothetical protein
MAQNEIFHLAVGPSSGVDANLLAQAAGIVSKNSYDMRVLLSGNMPRLAAHYGSLHEAESAARSLTDLGLAALVCRDSDLRKPLITFHAHTLRFGDGEVLFLDRSGRERAMSSGNLSLILRGTTGIRTETEETRTKTKFSLGATVLTGGIPVWRKVKEKNTDVSVQVVHFARLYDWESADSNVELSQHGMDYSFLGTDKAPSSIANFNTVVRKMREAFPQARFDDRLIGHSGGTELTARIGMDLESSCRLLYLYLRHMSATSATGD